VLDMNFHPTVIQAVVTDRTPRRGRRNKPTRRFGR
jgi:hypothetical protein